MECKAICTNLFLFLLLLLFFWLIPLMIIFDIIFNCCLNVKQIFPWNLKGSFGEYHLIDVRTKGEYNWFHIKDSNIVNAPFNNKAYESVNIPDDDKPLVIICMSGHRSPIVANKLEKQYTNRKIYNLYGGMLFWKLFCGTVAY